jgi:leader peptidase (prepilin peptidase) / N-methyltransferase
MDSADILFVFAIAGAGAIFGSFFSVVVHRLHTREGGFLTGSSHCPACGHELSGRDLVPVVSWLLSRGRCRYCGAGVSAAYPLMELATALVAVLASAGLAASQGISLANLPGSGEWWWLMGILLVLVPTAWYDLRYMEIPDEIVRPAALVLLLTHLLAWTSGWRLPFFGSFETSWSSSPLVE